MIGYRIFGSNYAKIRQFTGLSRKNNQIRERIENKLSKKLKTGVWDGLREDPGLLKAYEEVMAKKGNEADHAFWSEVARRTQRSRKTVVRRW